MTRVHSRAHSNVSKRHRSKTVCWDDTEAVYHVQTTQESSTTTSNETQKMDAERDQGSSTEISVWRLVALTVL
jgi:hypothetical protein